MTAMPAAGAMTAEEFLALPDLDLRSLELIDGEVVEDVTTLKHNRIQSELLVELVLWTRAAPDRGQSVVELHIRIGGRNVYKPDVVWYSARSVPERDDVAAYEPPDLAVEVRSPSTWRFNVGRKKDGYEQRGVGELWLVDHVADTVLVFRRSAPDSPRFDVALEIGRDETLTSPLLPGFAVALDQVFG